MQGVESAAGTNGGVNTLSGDSYDNTRALDGIHWRHVKFVEQFSEDRKDGRWLMMSDVCKHCVQAGCLEVCPTGAIIRTEFDTVVIQSNTCNGCRDCIAACPFGVIDINPVSNTAQKCTLCYDRLQSWLGAGVLEGVPDGFDSVWNDSRSPRTRASACRPVARGRRRPGVSVHIYAMFHTLRRDEPVRIRYDNKTLQTSLFFLGNSTYLPSGFAPSRRHRMDDGLMDVRILETGRTLSRLRILVSLVLGRLVRSPLYHEMRVPEFTFTTVDGPTVLAHDGEVGTELSEASFSVSYRALPVFRPLP